MNLPCRREAEHHGRGPAAKFVFQIFFSCCKSQCRSHTCECSASGIYFARQFRFIATVEQFLAVGEDVGRFRAFVERGGGGLSENKGSIVGSGWKEMANPIRTAASAF